MAGRRKLVDLEGWFCEDQLTIEDALAEAADPSETRDGAGETQHSRRRRAASILAVSP